MLKTNKPIKNFTEAEAIEAKAKFLKKIDEIKARSIARYKKLGIVNPKPADDPFINNPFPE